MVRRVNSGGVGPAPRVLIVSPFGLGDAIFAFPLIEAVKRARPEARVDFVANERTRELVEMNPSVDRAYEFNRDALRERWAARKTETVQRLLGWRRTIASAGYEAAFDLSLGREYALFLMLAGVRTRVGYDYKGRGTFLTDKKPLAGFEGRSVRETYLDLVRDWLPDASTEVRYPVLRAGQTGEWGRWAFARGIEPGTDYAILAPGGGRSWGRDAHYKQWDSGRFATLARKLAGERGWRVILVGDGLERELCDTVRRLAGESGIETMAGLPIGVVREALGGARIFVGNDGGLLHLADICGTRAVGIYGPVDERVYGPRPGARRAVVTRGVDCRPCYKNFRFPPCPHSKRCLEEIGLEDVLTSIDKVLKDS